MAKGLNGISKPCYAIIRSVNVMVYIKILLLDSAICND